MKRMAATNWMKWFGLKNDPFITRPLQFDAEFGDFLVMTSSIDEEFSSITNLVKESPFIRLVVGSRGIGKSTTLQYAINLCKKAEIPAIYVGLLPPIIKASKEPVFEITHQLMSQISQQLIRELSITRPSFFTKYKSSLTNWGKFVGLSYDDVEGFIFNPGQKIEFRILQDVLFGLLDLLSRNDLPLLVSIDNIDKLDSNTTINFLKGASSQPLFEKLNSSGASVLVASTPELAEIADNNPDLSFLRQKIVLSSLSPSESEDLISRRLNRYAIDPKVSIFDQEVVRHVCNEKKRNHERYSK